MKKSLIFILLFYVITSSSLLAQTYFLPYPNVVYQNLQPTWSHPSIDSTIIDDVMYSGHNHLFQKHSFSTPIEKDGYIYVVIHTGLVDAEGGLIEKIEKETGQIIWSIPFDRRTFDYNELPFWVSINENNELEIINYKMITSSDYLFPEFLFGTNATFSIRRYDLTSGELINHIYPTEPNYDFRTTRWFYQFLFKKEEQYFHIEKIRNSYLQHYLVRALDEELNSTTVDTVFLDLPEEGGVIYAGGMKAYPSGYISLDGKYLEAENRTYYILNFWNSNFEITKTISTPIDYFFGNELDFIELDHIDEEILLFHTRRTEGQQFVYKGFLMNHDGKLIQTFDYISPSGYKYISAKTFYNQKEKCPYFIGYRLENGILHNDLCKVSNDIELKAEINILPKNARLRPHNAIFLSNNDLFISHNLSKDTLLDVNIGNLNYIQGVIHTLYSSNDIGITSIDNPTSSVNINYLTVYPNPTRDILNIQLSISESLTWKLVEVYDMLGQKISSLNNFQGLKIDVSQLPNGIYTAIFTSDKGKKYQAKFKKIE